ncbi:IclR family transcriptional regulator [Azospirillum agricola]|uniref:IclR family transcriptional regulator n=1 Tax=Azospirillum agricola TaxID=1720247 RepID=UPI000A0F06FC|nr:IclR family transcriptional regulator [Azospirillum agricola]SMH46692.1 transcriptional regulator, IclR family [Azospirillum lipoferum]
MAPPPASDQTKTAGDSAPAPGGAAGTGTVSRALMLLSVLADAGGEVTVKYVSDTMQLSPSTAHRLLQLMKDEGYVEAVPRNRTYVVGPAFYRVAAKVVGSVSPVTMAQPVVEALAQRFDETVLFGLYLRTEQAMSFSARADGSQRLRYQIDIDKPLSLVWGASGKAIMAHLPKETIAAILAKEGPSPATGAPVPAADALAVELAAIRARGFAVSESEKLPDARGVAAPVFGASGVCGCLCLTSPKQRIASLSIDAIGGEIARAAHDLSRTLGAST